MGCIVEADSKPEVGEDLRSVYSPRYRFLIERLKQARLEAGLTQAQVAEAFGHAQSFVSKCESGERRVDVVELERFAKLYGKSLEFFLPEERDA